MAVNATMLQEQLERLNNLNETLKEMVKADRCAVSESCQRLSSYISRTSDPLLIPSATNPYLGKAKSGKKFLCF